ncbi:MAG: hypothetical protein RR280_10220 [Bacteroidaceae bacterium]
MIGVITKIYRQQHNHFESENTRESIPNRIVSVHKPYVRPIVRGKEVKSVEFGAKCNNIQIDGISFIKSCHSMLLMKGQGLNIVSASQNGYSEQR